MVTGVSTDSRSLGPGTLFFALPGARVDGHNFVAQVLANGAAAAVVSKDVVVPPEHRDKLVRVEDTLACLGLTANLYRRTWGGVVIGITGSNGKTTTREMTHHVLSEKIACKRSPKSFNTEVGVPLTLFTLDPEDKAAVVEMGTNAPGEIADLVKIAEPNMGVITSISESHLEGLGSVEGVARAKGELLQGLGAQGVAFLNADDAWYHFLRGLFQGRTVSVGSARDAVARVTEVKATENGTTYKLNGVDVVLNVPGRHNVTNSALALAVAVEMGLDLKDAAAGMATFTMPEMRYQVETIRGVKVAFDGYNANPGSMRAALDTFRDMPVAGRRVAVLGDMLELGEAAGRLHTQLGSDIARGKIQALWVIGKYSGLVAQAALKGGVKDVTSSDGFDAVAEKICRSLQPGDALLVKGSRGMKLERLVEILKASVG